MQLIRKTCIALCLGVAATAAMAQTDSAIKVGLLSTLSGPGAGLGVDIRDGFQLAVKLSGGKFGGKDVEVIVADDQASPDVGRQTADRLVKRDKVDFMTGIVFSNVLLAVGAPTFQSKTFGQALHTKQMRGHTDRSFRKWVSALVKPLGRSRTTINNSAPKPSCQWIVKWLKISSSNKNTMAPQTPP